ncbi:glycosyl transferase family protein [Enterobacter cancerogenus]|uniref:Glycosyl transferase family protein n=1 Tax=Enterobacter cancerogenus TaxID=69218 RepID=A0A484YYD3_9ENTR|nr:glycosyl transferase family protein [Enterobacter cancerogenus]
MFLSVVTVAFRNYEGVVKTWRSLRNLARDPSITFEWIVVDGGSNDGTAEFLEKLNGEFNFTLHQRER